MTIASQSAAEFVMQTLAADTGVGGVSTLCGARIYRDLVPRSASVPAIVIGVQTADDNNTTGGFRVFQSILVMIRVVGEGADYTLIDPIASRIDSVIQGLKGTYSGVYVNKFRRQMVEAYTETDEGRTFAHIMQMYRTEV